jgi:N-acyl amino acid synthase of PEP-CTERM/exosortase system
MSSSPLALPVYGGHRHSSDKPFDVAVLDAVSSLLVDSFRLRYEVYCLERQFLEASDYPLGLEFDKFDRRSVHVGAVDRMGALAGTARLVLPMHGTLPTLDHCALEPLTGPLWTARRRWVEVSRLSVSRTYGRRESGTDLAFGDRGDVLITVSKAVYLASKRLGATHWLVSIERSLARLLTRCGFPFRQLGPQFDYLGAVAPYSMDLAEFEEDARSGRYPQVTDFVASSDPDTREDHAGFMVPAALTSVINPLVSADA